MGFCLCLAIALTVFFNVHPYLAVNKPVQADVLIVEGWMTDQSIEKIVHEFQGGNYRCVYTTGGRITWTSAARYGGTYAGYCAYSLHARGVPTNAIVTIPSPEKDWDRTFTCAVAAREYMQSHGGIPKAANVITSGPHARRTRLLYQRAFGADISIGVISIPRRDYDPAAWWRSSTGVREVCSEALAYAYARVSSVSAF